jgi:hypothetical protein
VDWEYTSNEEIKPSKRKYKENFFTNEITSCSLDFGIKNLSKSKKII